MEIQFRLNGKQVTKEVAADAILLNVLRDLGCTSVKCGCETTNCGLCTVWVDEKPRLSCSILAASMAGHSVTTLEGAGRSRGIRKISGGRGSRTVRILCAGIYHERAGDGA